MSRKSGDSSRFASNPFATKFIRAGSIPFIFPDGQSVERIMMRLSEANWWGQIIGPHGSGKTSLLRSLDRHWEFSGRKPVELTLRDGKRKLPREDTFQPHTQVVIDGFEQLGFLSRWRWITRCRRSRCGLLITSHRPLSLPTVYKTETNVSLATQVVHHLAPDSTCPARDEIASCFVRARGNLRETLLLLYDLHQDHARREPPTNC